MREEESATTPKGILKRSSSEAARECGARAATKKRVRFHSTVSLIGHRHPLRSRSGINVRHIFPPPNPLQVHYILVKQQK